MIPYKLDYTIEKTLENQGFNAQRAIKNLTGKSLNRTEAENVWLQVQKHKWLVSKDLGRDIGLRVAAIDYLENFYQRQSFFTNFVKKIKHPISSIV